MFVFPNRFDSFMFTDSQIVILIFTKYSLKYLFGINVTMNNIMVTTKKVF